MTIYAKHLKRPADALLASIGLIITLPLMAVIAVAVKLTSPGPVLYRQVRLGLDGHTFTLLKFRSMTVGAESAGVYTGPSDPRVTTVGRIIRALSLDELPQLWNIVRGHMSLVGPRPVLPTHPKPLEAYTPVELRRFTVRPGITGWAQVHGRKNLPWPLRLEYDAWYAANVSLRIDALCVAKTITQIAKFDENVNIGKTVD